MENLLEEKRTTSNLRMVLLGTQSVGKTSVGNTILGFKEQESGERTQESVVRKGFVENAEIMIVDTPGWCKDFPVVETPEVIKEELMSSMFLCPPGPHVFLLVINVDTTFNAKHLESVTTHMKLLGEGVWRHTIIVFTGGEWLGTQTIEEYIEGEGQALQSLLEQCGNRYYVLCRNANDGAQATELLEKITWTVAGNRGDHFVADEQIFEIITEKRRKVKEGATLRKSQVRARRKSLGRSWEKLQELRIVMLGQRKFGKSATGNTILRKEVFSTSPNEQCRVEVGQVADRLVTVIDTPGWVNESSLCTEQTDKEIVRALSLSPLGVHAVLLVVPLNLMFGEEQRVALEEHMSLFDANIWKHTIVLFTHGDRLAEKSVEEHIERGCPALHWLVDKCGNKYHTVNNMKKSDMSQITELFEKIEEMVVENTGQIFSNDMNATHLRMYEKFRRRQLKQVLKQQLAKEYRRRELELMTDFKKKLEELQDDIRKSTTPKSPVADMTKQIFWNIGYKKKDIKKKLEKLEEKISEEIERLDKHITSTHLLSSSIENIRPGFSGDHPRTSFTESLTDQMKSTSNFDKVLGWLSTLQISTNVDNQVTLKFSETSGYGSILHDKGSFLNE